MIIDDIRLDVLENPNKGGQQVPSCNYGVKGTHLSTGLIASCKSERSQHRNKEIVIIMLEAGIKKIEENK